MEWIAVKDRLPDLMNQPEHDGRLISCDVDGFVGMTDWLDDGFYQFIGKGWVMDKSITHWMELPSPPKQS
tara:strand:- start:4022 stop:4231 length:210 start_codon:yes stop_codon:yes gene_type:complete